mmetsp:Transcript_26413/g.48568  ORF Transcript_26413/g.48568 Transcript_26413/m.48568 type:complete len:410 (+) Transcript_26413:764-1993(+)
MRHLHGWSPHRHGRPLPTLHGPLAPLHSQTIVGCGTRVCFPGGHSAPTHGVHARGSTGERHASTIRGIPSSGVSRTQGKYTRCCHQSIRDGIGSGSGLCPEQSPGLETLCEFCQELDDPCQLFVGRYVVDTMAAAWYRSLLAANDTPPRRPRTRSQHLPKTTVGTPIHLPTRHHPSHDGPRSILAGVRNFREIPQRIVGKCIGGRMASQVSTRTIHLSGEESGVDAARAEDGTIGRASRRLRGWRCWRGSRRRGGNGNDLPRGIHRSHDPRRRRPGRRRGGGRGRHRGQTHHRSRVHVAAGRRTRHPLEMASSFGLRAHQPRTAAGVRPRFQGEGDVQGGGVCVREASGGLVRVGHVGVAARCGGGGVCERCCGCVGGVDRACEGGGLEERGECHSGRGGVEFGDGVIA